MGLMAYCETKRVTEDEVLMVQEPAYTKTWHPMSHKKVIDATGMALREYNLSIEKKEYSLSKDGKNMFGVWTLEQMEQDDQGIRCTMGIRNSLKKQFAVGICAGNKVMVCDNMVFSGEFIEFRKHTARLDMDEMIEVATKAIIGVIQKMDILNKWHLRLKEHNLPEKDFKALTFDSMKAGAFAPRQFSNFLHAYDEENKVQNGHAGTLYAFHGAITRVMRNDSFFRIANKSKHLTRAIDDYMELKSLESGTPPGFFKRLKDKVRKEE